MSDKNIVDFNTLHDADDKHEIETLELTRYLDNVIELLEKRNKVNYITLYDGHDKNNLETLELMKYLDSITETTEERNIINIDVRSENASFKLNNALVGADSYNISCIFDSNNYQLSFYLGDIISDQNIVLEKRISNDSEYILYYHKVIVRNIEEDIIMRKVEEKLNV